MRTDVKVVWLALLICIGIVLCLHLDWQSKEPVQPTDARTECIQLLSAWRYRLYSELSVSERQTYAECVRFLADGEQK